MRAGDAMIERLLPRRIDNDHGGHPLALWIFALVVIMKTGIALGTLLNGRAAAQSADGIPLDAFGDAGAQTVVALFALWGLAQLVPGALGALALLRYRAMIPLLYSLFLAEQLARKVVLMAKPIPRAGTPPGLWINYALYVLMIAGLALSLRRRPGATG